MALIMAGLMDRLLNHPCVYGTLDKGSECRGAGKGGVMARRREAFLGTGSYLEQIWGTRAAPAAVMQGEHAVFLG